MNDSMEVKEASCFHCGAKTLCTWLRGRSLMVICLRCSLASSMSIMTKNKDALNDLFKEQQPINKESENKDV